MESRLPEFDERLYKVKDMGKLKELLRSFFIQTDNIFAAYLFGSILQEGIAHDLDIGIFTNKELDELRIGSKVEVYLFGTGIKIPVDLRILNEVPVWVKYNVISKGYRIYPEGGKDILNFEAQIIMEYLDFEQVSKQYNNMFLKRLKDATKRHTTKTYGRVRQGIR